MLVLDHNNKEILVDEAGYQQFALQLEKLKLQSLNIATIGSQSYKDAVGDGWHDNFDFEDSMRESRTIAKRIERMLLEQKNLKVVVNKKTDGVVNIGDTVKLEIIYNEDYTEIEMVTLTGKYIPSDDNEITLNSPIGRAIYKRKIGSTNHYQVDNKFIKVRILERL